MPDVMLFTGSTSIRSENGEVRKVAEYTDCENPRKSAKRGVMLDDASLRAAFYLVTVPRLAFASFMCLAQLSMSLALRLFFANSK